MQNTISIPLNSSRILENILSISDEILQNAEQENIEEVSALLAKRGELIQEAILHKDIIRQSARQRRLHTERTITLLQEKEIHLKKVFKDWSDRIFHNLQKAQKLKQISNYVSPNIITRGTL